jgi:ABC-type transport system involved in multi-copper enzyme maturation permease subunit
MVNPIFLRVMSMSGRQSRHVWVRVGYLVIMLLTLIVMLLSKLAGSSSQVALAELGESLFRAVSYAQLVLILFLSPIYTAGAISQERDSQTFSVLLATPLSNFQIVAGSLMSRLFFVLAILFSTLPLFAMVYYFGGFELRDVFLSYGIAAMSALLTGAVAIAISILYTGTRRVMVGFFLFITLYLVGFWLLDHQLLRLVISTWKEGSLDWLHPIGAIQKALEGGQVQRLALRDETFWGLLVDYPEYGYLLYSFGLSAAILVLAAVLVRRLARGYGGIAKWVGRIAQLVAAAGVAALILYLLIHFHGLQAGLIGFAFLVLLAGGGLAFFHFKRHRQPRSVWDNPITWRERVTRTSTARRTLVQFLYIIVSLLALYVVLLLKVAHFPAETARWFVFIVTMTQMFVLLMVGATMAASCISYEREQGTLDILLTTPITPRYFIVGKLWGIIRYLGLFLAMIFLVTLGAALIARFPVENYLGQLVPAQWAARMGPAAGPLLPGVQMTWASWPLASAFLPLLVTGGLAAAVVTIGMTFSLRTKKSSTASLYSALVVLGATLGLSGCCILTGIVPVVGRMACLASPFLAMFACLMPEEFAVKYEIGTWERSFQDYFGIYLGALGAALSYGLFAWFRMKGMVKTFDQQTRQKL